MANVKAEKTAVLHKCPTGEYPFLTGDTGLFVLPIMSVDLDYDVSTERISTGISRLDTMFGGKGYYRVTSVLVSGTIGTDKSSMAATFADAACARGMAYFNQIREFLLTDKGIDLLDIYVGLAGVLTGLARATQIAEEKTAKLLCQKLP